MKKKLWPIFVIAVLLAFGGLGFTLAYMTEPLTYDQIEGYDDIPPVLAAHTVVIFHEGDYPGMSDTPITAEQAAPGRKVLEVLQAQEYTRLPFFLKPTGDGTAITETIGCSSWCVAYWDNKYLWSAKKHGGQWSGYAPSSPDKINEILASYRK